MLDIKYGNEVGECQGSSGMSDIIWGSRRDRSGRKDD